MAIICQLTIRTIYLQNVIIDDAQSTSRSENPFLIVLKLSANDPLYGLVINLTKSATLSSCFLIGQNSGGTFSIGGGTFARSIMKNMSLLKHFTSDFSFLIGFLLQFINPFRHGRIKTKTGDSSTLSCQF